MISINKCGYVGNIIIVLLALPGIIFFSLIAHEMTHIIQSKGTVYISYDMQQSSFAHVMHDISMWDSENEFSEFVEKTEKTADRVETIAGHGSAMILGSALGFMIIFKKKEE